MSDSKSRRSLEQKTVSTKPAAESKINRRDFMNAVARAAIPTIAFLSLGRSGKLAAQPKKESHPSGKGQAKEPKDCVLTCEGGCRGCEGECLGTCKDACFVSCEGSCKYTCEGGCTGKCEGMCKGSCEGTCSGQAW